MQYIIDRFISYVTIDTESDPNSDTTPSTKKQKRKLSYEYFSTDTE